MKPAATARNFMAVVYGLSYVWDFSQVAYDNVPHCRIWGQLANKENYKVTSGASPRRLLRISIPTSN